MDPADLLLHLLGRCRNPNSPNREREKHVNDYEKLQLPMIGIGDNEGGAFTVLGFANVPLDQNWAKKGYQGGLKYDSFYRRGRLHSTTRGAVKSAESYKGVCRSPQSRGFSGWLMTGDHHKDPQSVKISYGRDIADLAAPDTTPLDGVTINGINTRQVKCLSDFGISNQTIENHVLEFIPLVLQYDLEDKDPSKTLAWISTSCSPNQRDTRLHNVFRQVVVSHYFNRESLEKRIARFHKQLKKTFKCD